MTHCDLCFFFHLLRTRSTPPPPQDPNAPKKPANAFLMYCQQERQKVQDGEGNGIYSADLSHQDLTRQLAKQWKFLSEDEKKASTVEPLYNEVLGTMKITLLYQVSHYIRVKKKEYIKSWDQQNYLVIRGFCYIRPRYNEVPLYHTATMAAAAAANVVQGCESSDFNLIFRLFRSLQNPIFRLIMY